MPWKMLDGEIDSPCEPEICLDLRDAIIDSLSKLKEDRPELHPNDRAKSVDVFGGCVGTEKDGDPTEFIIGFEYKGMAMTIKGLIGPICPPVVTATTAAADRSLQSTRLGKMENRSGWLNYMMIPRATDSPTSHSIVGPSSATA